eukprot:5002300-Prorocentrum_lima.AAC.1
MTSSLVGSEMCIRDRCSPKGAEARPHLARWGLCGVSGKLHKPSFFVSTQRTAGDSAMLRRPVG